MGGLVHDGGSWRVYTETVVHGHGLDFPSAFAHRWVCLGYRVETENKTIAIGGDCVACEGLERLARDADVFVQCCYLTRSEIKTPPVGSYCFGSSFQECKYRGDLAPLERTYAPNVSISG